MGKELRDALLKEANRKQVSEMSFHYAQSEYERLQNIGLDKEAEQLRAYFWIGTKNAEKYGNIDFRTSPII